MRALLTAVLVLVLTAVGVAAERSFTLEGDRYVLDFPADMKYGERTTDDGTEYVFFFGETIGLQFTVSLSCGDIPIDRVDGEQYLRDQTADGRYRIKMSKHKNVILYGACFDNETDGSCIYFISGFVPENARWLHISVVCGVCDESEQRGAGELAEHLKRQF